MVGMGLKAQPHLNEAQEILVHDHITKIHFHLQRLPQLSYYQLHKLLRFLDKKVLVSLGICSRLVLFSTVDPH